MTDTYVIDNRIFRFIMGYSIREISLPKITENLIEYIQSMGYDASIVDDKHRDYRIIEVDGHHFRIVRNKDWLRYDSKIID